MINRRAALKQFLLIGAGAAIVPGCLPGNDKALQALNNISITRQQEQTIEALAGIILPATKTPGAKEIQAPAFVLTMVDDCYKKEDQALFIKGLEAFEAFAKEKTGKAFIEADAAAQNNIISALQAKQGDAATDSLLYFYTKTRALTIQAYTSSKFYMTNIKGYKMLPGTFKGCVPLLNT